MPDHSIPPEYLDSSSSDSSGSDEDDPYAPWKMKGNIAAKWTKEEKHSIATEHQQAGNELFRQNKLNEALKEYEKAFRILLPALADDDVVRRELCHHEVKILGNMAAVKYKQKEYRDVIHLCSKIITEGFQDTLLKAHFRRGVCSLFANDLDLAKKDLLTAIDLAADDEATIKSCRRYLRETQEKLAKYKEKEKIHFERHFITKLNP